MNIDKTVKHKGGKNFLIAIFVIPVVAGLWLAYNLHVDFWIVYPSLAVSHFLAAGAVLLDEDQSHH